MFAKSEAHRGDIYLFDGTSPEDLVVLLQKYGVQSDLTTIHLNDSDTPDGRDEQIPMATFTQAWATSNDLLIVTQETSN